MQLKIGLDWFIFFVLVKRTGFYNVNLLHLFSITVERHNARPGRHPAGHHGSQHVRPWGAFCRDAGVRFTTCTVVTRADTVEPWFRKGRTSKKRVSKSNKKKMWNDVIWRHLSNWFGALQTKYKITNVAQEGKGLVSVCLFAFFLLQCRGKQNTSQLSTFDWAPSFTFISMQSVKVGPKGKQNTEGPTHELFLIKKKQSFPGVLGNFNQCKEIRNVQL